MTLGEANKASTGLATPSEAQSPLLTYGSNYQGHAYHMPQLISDFTRNACVEGYDRRVHEDVPSVVLEKKMFPPDPSPPKALLYVGLSHIWEIDYTWKTQAEHWHTLLQWAVSIHICICTWCCLLKIYYLVSLFVLFSGQGFVCSANIGFFIMIGFFPAVYSSKENNQPENCRETWKLRDINYARARTD
jgi:hypothetical protein